MPKATSHMQLWYGDGYRNLHCCKCKKMSRSTHWQCSHGILWHKCLQHRQDPHEHTTTRAVNGQGTRNPKKVELQSADRPEPQPKVPKTSRVRKFGPNLKRIVQSLNPTVINIDWAKCPKLARKFPHLHNVADAMCINPTEHTEPSEEVSMQLGSCEGVPDTTTNQLGTVPEPPPVTLTVQKTRRGFRYPIRGAAASSSGDHQSFLPTDGVFVRKAGESERSHNREDDQRSELL